MNLLPDFLSRLCRRKPGTAIFATRPRYTLVCPCCGAAQHRDEDQCHGCGAPFFFLDEGNRFGS